jgi:aminoglycoside phosphotransferase
VDDQITFARRTLENNEVQVSLLDTDYRGRSLNDLFREMVAHRPDTLDPVVVHGDPYNENILVNSDTGEIAALIDVGNTGVADRYTDLAMIYDDIVHAFGQSGWEKFLQYYGLMNFDSKKMYFYRLFNEFL